MTKSDHQQIQELMATYADAEVAKARAALKKDTLQLVALATEKVVGEKLDVSTDAKLVERAITEGRA